MAEKKQAEKSSERQMHSSKRAPAQAAAKRPPVSAVKKSTSQKTVPKLKNKAHPPTASSNSNEAVQSKNLSRQAQTKTVKKASKGTLKKTAEFQKKNSRRNLRRQKLRRRIATAFLVSIMLAICIYISLKVLFIVHDVQATGSERYTSEEIIEYCAIPLEENIFKIDVNTLSALLVENFTYIEKADVRRRLPDKIQITITDSVPTYYMQSMQGETAFYTVYSQNFKKLTVQSQQPDGLMWVSADIDNTAQTEIVYTLIDLLKTSEFNDITKIDIVSDSNIQLVYQNRITVKLGTMLDMEYKLKMSKYVLLNEVEDTVHGTLDSTKAGTSVIKPDI